MTPNRYSRQWNTALATITAAIEEAKRVGAVRLPSVKVLAARAGVSALTMWRAVRSVCEQGALVSIPRGGFLLTGRDIPSVVTGMPTTTIGAIPRWRSVMERLCREVESRRLSGQRLLPTQKELAATYRTSAGSIRKALRELERTGQIEPSGRGYIVRTDSPFGATAEIMVIARLGSREECHHMSPRSTELWRNLDLQCSRRNIRLRLVSVGKVLRAFESGRGALYDKLVGDPVVLGYIVLTLGFTELETRKLCGYMAPRARAVALVDELGQPYMAEAASIVRGRLYHLGGGELAGRLVGEHLARAGHTDVAWVAPAHGDDDFWLTQRLQGLRSGLTAGGRKCSVTVHTLSEFAGLSAIGPAILSDPVFGALSAEIAAIPSRIPPACEAQDSLFVNRVANRYLWFRFVRARMEPLFARLVASHRTTAWVACNDDVAIMALDFLQRHRVPVPGRVSLAGFDDSELAQTRDLTSYNFNVPATIQAVFDYIVRSEPRGRVQAGQDIIEVPGFVAVRSSTSRRLSVSRSATALLSPSAPAGHAVSSEPRLIR